MSRFRGAVLLVPLVLALAACTPVPPSPSDSQSQSPKPTATVTAEPQDDESPAVDGPVDPQSYLLEGALNEDPDGDGFWSAHYGFYFEPSKSARCDIHIFSGDDPEMSCSIVPGNESKVTYDLPVGAQCDDTTAGPFDGYTLALGSKGLSPARAGFIYCQESADGPAPFAAETKTLGEGQSITVEPFGCVVTGETVGCSFTDDSGSITFGLHSAAHAG